MTEDKISIKDRYNSISSGISTVSSAITMGRDLKARYNQKFMYTASLDQDSFIYGDVLKYIDAKTKTRNFKFHCTREGVYRYYDSSATATFYLDGYKVKASLKKPTMTGFSADKDSDYDAGLKLMAKPTKEQLWFTCSSPAALNALENLFLEMTRARQTTSRTNYVVNTDSWGNWEYEDLPPKDMGSVFLPTGVKEGLLGDFEHFLASESKYNAVGLPYHRGYAFYGEPGNGKSSLALALANHFNMDLYNLPLSIIREDKALVKCINDLRKNSILLLEDIDVFSNSVSRDHTDGASTPTLAGLLNALDGVSTPHGMITIMTTNHIEKLDPALIRPGRMDYKLELEAPVDSQVQDMFVRVFGEPLGIESRQFKSMAAVADVFKRNIDNAEDARLELKNE